RHRRADATAQPIYAYSGRGGLPSLVRERGRCETVTERSRKEPARRSVGSRRKGRVTHDPQVQTAPATASLSPHIVRTPRPASRALRVAARWPPATLDPGRSALGLAATRGRQECERTDHGAVAGRSNVAKYRANVDQHCTEHQLTDTVSSPGRG